MEGSQWWVYIIETQAGKLYTGITTNIERRFKEHSGEVGKNKGAKYFRTDPAKKIVYQEESDSRSEAGKRECEIKKMTRVKKLKLINGS